MLLNLILAPLLILYFQLGITGAAVATLISQCFGCAMLFWMTHKGREHPHPSQQFHPYPRLCQGDYLRRNPSLSRQGLGSIATLMLNVAAGAFGDAAIAGMSIVTRISFFTYAMVIGLGTGIPAALRILLRRQTLWARKGSLLFCIKCGTVFLSVCALLGFIFSTSIISIFRDDAAVVAVGSVALRWQVLSFPLVASIVLTNMLMQTIRKPVRANIVAAARSGLFFIPLIFILPISSDCWAWRCVRCGQIAARLPLRFR